MTKKWQYTKKQWELITQQLIDYTGFLDSSVPANAGDVGLIAGSGRSPGEGNGKPLQYSCLENPMDRGAWKATVSGVARAMHDSGTKQQ